MKFFSPHLSIRQDEEKGGWMEALRGHLKEIQKKKDEEGIDLTQDPFNLTYSNFFQVSKLFV